MRILMPVLVRMPSARAPALQTANMAQALVELGHDVVVASPAPPLPTELPDGWSGPSTAEADARLLGFTPGFRVVHGARRVRRGQSLTQSARVARLARRLRPDLVLTRDLRAAVLPALRGVPTVVELHALTSVGSTLDRAALRRLRSAPGHRGLVAISDPLAEDLVAQGLATADEVLVAPDAVRIAPDAHDVTVDRPAADGARPRVGYTGSLYPGKGAEAVVALAERCPWADFHVAGGPAEEAERLRRTAERRENLVVHGLLAQPETLALQRSCDVLVAPFAPVVRSDSGVDIARWTSPLKVFEYLASGRPSVIGDLPGLRGVLRDGEDAIVVPAGDVDAFAAALERLTADQALADRIGRAGRAAAVGRWSWSARAERILERFVPREVAA